MKKYTFNDFKKDYEKFRKDFMRRKSIGDYSFMDLVALVVNCLIFPAIFLQMLRTWRRKESADFNPLFIILQLFGGLPEGILGAIVGDLNNNKQMIAIGSYAAFYNLYMLFFRCFGKKGLIKPIF
tara:strand:- start:644 stop:1018 length:375 start_codon:yes stop_codon:yes gene_type:complete